MTVPSIASDLSGMSDPRGTLTAEMSGRASSPVLVGRDEQMAALDAAFASARQGGPSAVLLGGEAGVGKSRLVGEFGRTAAAAGARVLIGGCLELGTDGLPFAPFTAVLRDLVHEKGADAVAAMLPGRTTRGLARLLPELGEPDTGGDPAEARARLFEEVLRALEYLTRHSPVVLVIEDAHWADRSSRDLLTFLIGNQRALSGLLIVVTFRSDELHRTHPLRPLLASLDRIDWVERIELPRLTRNDTGELVVRILGRQPAGDLADALYHRSEGNPLFIEALLCCDGELSQELPESLRDLLLDSVRRLPEDTQEVLRIASAGGETTGHALLGAVSGLDDAALTRAVRPAVIAKLGRQDYAEDLSDALDFVPAGVAPATRVDILLALAHCPPNVTNERAYAEEALALARQLDDEAKEANALLTLAMFNADNGQQAPSDSGPLDLIAQARAMAERRGADDVLLHAAVNESHLLEGAGEHERAAEVARRATVSADPQLLSRTSGSVLAINQAEPLCALGRWDEALTIASGARDLYLAPGPMNRALLQVITGFIALARGDQVVAARAVLAARDALRSARYEDQHQLPLARMEILLALAQDGPAAALGTVSQIMDRCELSGGSPRYTWPVVTAGTSVVLAAARQAGVAHDERLRDEAASVAERLRTVAEKLGTFGPAQRAFQLTFAAADRHGARLLGGGPIGGGPIGGGPIGGGPIGGGEPGDSKPGSGEPGGGEPGGLLAAWDEAATAWAALSEPYPLSETLLHAAETALACGDRDGAAERLGRALPLATDLGAHPLTEQIAILARRARIRLNPETGEGTSEGPGDPATGNGELGLTERELEVLRLVTAGRSNREIAAELFISPKTASVHVSNILGKLGVASRGEAAARAYTLRLFDPTGTA